ncbi:MAG: PHP domain-containing protein, partial [Kiritimatiellia bacterium]
MIDLHTHSSFSDGSFTPEQLIHEAAFQRLSAVALTDHDSIEGLDRFLAAGRDSAVRAVPGVEISADCAQGTMHILGYLIDHHEPGLRDSLATIRAGRVARNNEILKHINDMGMPLTMTEVAAYAGEDNIGRLHFAQAMV